MLVLSRRTNQEILFPNSGIRLRVLGVRGNAARIGIEAPPEVEVFRGELVPAEGLQPPAAPALGHAVRNRLNKAVLWLYHAEQLWRGGQPAEAEAAFRKGIVALESLDKEWPGRPAAPPRRCRALIVEDDANERELLAGLLALQGCECATAADGHAALEYLAANALPDVVLLDMGLPRVSGPQLLRRLRQEPRCRDLKVFAVSGADPDAVGVAVGNDGVDAWFAKPLSPARLWEAIQAAN